MITLQQANADQAQRWNGPAGATWVALQEMLDTIFAPLVPVLTETLANTGVHHVLDVGCGTGATSLAIARQLGNGGQCTGTLTEAYPRRARAYRARNIDIGCGE